MKLTKKEKTLIVIFAVLVYAFVSVKFVLMPSLPKIKEAKNRIETAQIQLDALEKDYSNINQYKNQIKENKVIDERLGSYLTNSASISDSVEFVENLAVLMGTSLKGISLGSPQENIEGGTTYYAFPINFTTILSEDGLSELIKFCEGGSKKVTIRQLNINPTSEGITGEFGSARSNKQHFNLNVGLIFYSMDKDAANSLVNFTRAALERFFSENDMPIFIEEAQQIPEVMPSQATQVSDTTSGDPFDITLMNADFKIFHRGYLYGGYNFEAYTEFNKDDRIRFEIDIPIDISIVLGKTQYTIECIDGSGHTKTSTGNLSDRNFTLYIQSNINNSIEANENLWVNLKIKNDSGKNIRAKMEQTGDRVKILDRDGNSIDGSSEKEKLYF